MAGAPSAGVKGFLLGLVFSALIAACGSIDPLGPRVCECDLLKEWASDLPILPGGVSITEGITAQETDTQFEVHAGSSPVSIDDRYKRAMIDSFTAQGLQHEIRSDTKKQWYIVFFPGSPRDRLGPETSWRLDLVYTSVLGLRVVVNVDGAQYGINSIDDLWQNYEDDREAAADIQEERQREALSLLEPVNRAASSLAS